MMKGSVTYWKRSLPLSNEPYELEGRDTWDMLDVCLDRSDDGTCVRLKPYQRQDCGRGVYLRRITLEHGNPKTVGFKVTLRGDGAYDRALVDRATGCLETYCEVFAGMFRDGRFAEIDRIIREACADPEV